MQNITELIGKYGFPIVAAMGLCGLVYYIWNWVTKEIKPVVSETNKVLISLIDKIRLLDQDLIRLDQKVNTVINLRKRNFEKRRIDDT